MRGGSALLVNDPSLAERAEIIREKGTNRARLFRGQVDKYTLVDIGSSYLPSDILAAYLYGQLEKRAEIQAHRQNTWKNYYAELKDWATSRSVGLPVVPAHSEQAYHMFYLLLPTLELRQRFIACLKEHGIQSVFHYLPLHRSDMGRQFGGRGGDCPITEWVSDQLVRLPFHNGLRPDEQQRVVEAVLKFEF